MENKIQLIALDMDGTLLTGNHEVTERTKQAIAQAREKGVQVMLSTGRWLNTCYSYYEELQLDSYIITVNGGEIWSPEKELVEQHLFSAEKMEKMWHIGHEAGARMWLVSSGDIFIDQVPAGFSDYQWLKIGYDMEDKHKLDHIVKELSSIEDLELSNSLPTNVEVNPIGVNKANALKSVTKKMGITMENVLTIGDSLNDIKMIQEAGIGVAMGNAQEAIKKVANHVTDTNENDGVAKAIEKFIL